MESVIDLNSLPVGDDLFSADNKLIQIIWMESGPWFDFIFYFALQSDGIPRQIYLLKRVILRKISRCQITHHANGF